MKKLKLSVSQYRAEREKEIFERFGDIDEDDRQMIERRVKVYAIKRQQYKSGLQDGDFNPFTDDPNCKTCKKKKV